MSLSLGIGLALRGAGAGAPAPTLASINYSQADIIGGGQDLVVTGTNLAGASAVTVGGAAATLVGSTATTCTFTMPARAAGTYDVVVTAPGGTATLAGAVEAWAPSTLTSCKFFCSAPGYESVTATLWTSRVGFDLQSQLGTAPNDAGSAVFDGSAYLEGSGLASVMSTTAGTAFVVTSTTNTPVLNTASPFVNPAVLALATNGTLGISFGTSGGNQGALFHVQIAGVYQTAFVQAPASTMQSVCGRFNASAVEVALNAGTFVSTATSGAWTSALGNMRVGGQYNAARDFRGTTRAVATFDAYLSNADVLKCHKWAQQRFGI